MLPLENYFSLFDQRYGQNTNAPFRLHLFFGRSFSAPTGFDHDLMMGSGFPSSFLLPVNNAISQSMLGNSPSGAGLVSDSNYWSTLWVLHNSSSDFNQYTPQSHSKRITAILEFIKMSNNASSTGIPTTVTTDTDQSVSHDPWMFPVITWFEGTTINLTDGIFNCETGLSASMLSFVNRTTGWWYDPYFTISGCANKETFVDAFSTSLFLHNSLVLLYRDRMSYSDIILSGQWHITNWYCNSSARHLCTKWGTLASYLKKTDHCNLRVPWILIPKITLKTFL